MKYNYKTRGVCSQFIEFDITDGILSDVTFYGGCNGNLKAIGKLVEGKNAAEVAEILKGNLCGNRGTSCGDQLSQAITAALAQQTKEV